MFLYFRIVIVSSLAHEMARMNWDDLNWEKCYYNLLAYCQSKLANVLHANGLAKRMEPHGISVYSLHPGMTELWTIFNSNFNFHIFNINMCHRCHRHRAFSLL